MDSEYKRCIRLIDAMTNPMRSVDFWVPDGEPAARIRLVAVARTLTTFYPVSPPKQQQCGKLRKSVPDAPALHDVLDEANAREALALRAEVLRALSIAEARAA